jgi:predicted transcriptional regulator
MGLPCKNCIDISEALRLCVRLTQVTPRQSQEAVNIYKMSTWLVHLKFCTHEFNQLYVEKAWKKIASALSTYRFFSLSLFLKQHRVKTFHSIYAVLGF